MHMFALYCVLYCTHLRAYSAVYLCTTTTGANVLPSCREDGSSMWAKVLSAVWRGALIFDRIAFYKLGTLFFESSL